MKKNFFIVLLVAFTVFSCKEQSQESQTDETTILENNIVSEPVTYIVSDVEMNGEIFYDESIEDPKPGIMVVHEWWGHNDYVKERAKQLAELGYVGFAIDMYGDGKLAEHPEDAQKFAGEVMQDQAGAKDRFMKAMEVLQNHKQVSGEEIGAIGYCFGGGVVLAMANQSIPDLDGVVSFHGSLIPPDTSADNEMNTKVLVLNGEADPFVTEEQITAYKEAMEARNADYEFINYPGAVHAFTSRAADSLGQKFDLPLAYDKTADEKSWKEMQEFFTNLWN